MGTISTKANLAQLKRLRALTKGTDVGDKISDITKKWYNGTNGATYKNALDGYVDNWSDYMKNQRKYLNQADKKLKTFEGFFKKSDDEKTAHDIYDEMVRLYEDGKLPGLDGIGWNVGKFPVNMTIFNLPVVFQYVPRGHDNIASGAPYRGKYLKYDGVYLEVSNMYLRKFVKYFEKIVSKAAKKSHAAKRAEKDSISSKLRDKMKANQA